MQDAVSRREQARLSLRQSREEVEKRCGPAELNVGTDGWSVRANTINDRLDAAFHASWAKGPRKRLEATGSVLLSDWADAELMVRYKRYYVAGENGRPIVSGRQLLQAEPINLRRVSDRSFRDPESYAIRAGTVIFGADGRAEGRQGTPALVTTDRDGWLASNHVMRLIPKNGVSSGALWLAVASQQAQIQIRSLSFGSVVDQINPGDVGNVLLPEVSGEEGETAEEAWEIFAEAGRLARKAINEVEILLLSHD